MSNKEPANVSDILDDFVYDEILENMIEENMIEVVYIDIEWALKQHDIVLKESGGLSGILNLDQLESILTAIENNQYYPYFTEKITHLVFGICEYHVFADANKRTAIALGAYFLKINGYEDCIDRFIIDMEYLVVMLVEHKLKEIPGYSDEKNVLSEFIACIIFDSDYPPELDNLLMQYKAQTS